MSTVLPSNVYPAAIDHKLRQVRRRQCALAVLRAKLLGLSVLLAAMLLAMSIDWCFTLYSTAGRLALTVSALVAGIATILIAAVGPVVASLGLRRAARDIDRATPVLEERWTTVASFVETNHRPRSDIGRAMLQQVTSEAVAMGQLVEPVRVATPGQLRRAAVLCAAAATFMAAFLGVNWQHNFVLWQRFWRPLANITATQLESVSGDLVVPRGEPVELAIRLSGLPRDTATLVLKREGAADESVRLPASEEDSALFSYHVVALDSSFRYRAQAGDGQTGWHSVTAIDRPALAEVTLTLTAPDYVARPVYEKNYLPARVQAVQGSRLRLEMRPEAALKSLVLRISQIGTLADGQQEAPLVEHTQQLLADKDGWYRYEAVLEQDVTLAPELLGPYGLSNEDAQKCSIRVIPDRAPIARVISPTEETAVRPDEVLDVKFEAHDDHGIARAELIVYEESPNADDPPTILGVEDIPLQDQQNAPHVQATARLDLSKYELREGAGISFAVRVTDNRIAMREVRREESRLRSNPVSTADSETGQDTTRQLADARRTTAPPDESKPDRRSEYRPGESANAGERKPLPERAGAEGAPKSETPRSANEQPANAPDTTKPMGATKAASPAGDSAEDDKREPTTNKNSETGRADPSRLPPDSIVSTRPEAPATDKKSTPTRPDEGKDAQPAPSDPGPPASKSDGATSDKLAANDTPTKSSRESPRDESGSSPAGDDPKNPQPPGAAAAPSPGAMTKNDDQPLRDSQSRITGDLTSVDRRPNMTDDLRGQFTESNRLRLKIEEKVIAAGGQATDRDPVQMKIRRRLEEIDRELKPAEQVLTALVATAAQSAIADPQIQELNGVDRHLVRVDEIIGALRLESKETPYAFAGLHMVDVGAAHITPARDRIFALIRRPDVDTHANVAEALHRVSRARELLAELLARYERVLRERRLADAIEETAKIYEVYVENLHRFLRAQSKPNPNPLQRKMAIVEVDQEYLERLRVVTEMRRDLMAEFARMVADDPRLLSKYMDLIKRRQTSLRDRLTELHGRQDVIATELGGWRRVDPAQRDDVWMLAAELRLQDVAPLAQEASQLEERMTSQFPLSLDPQHRNSAAVIDAAKQIAVRGRTAAAKARRLLRDPSDQKTGLASEIGQMAHWFSELDAALEILAFENAAEETTEYVNKRLAESRTLFERIIAWIEIAEHLQARRFAGLANVDQRQLAFRTELLRIDMAGIDQQLAGEFRGEVPPSVTALADELKLLMEAITFNQAAATFELKAERLAEAETQQALALKGFEQAEELFDRIRRQVIEELDQIDPRNPNIADLEDPTLDELLERLEREPDLNALLGLPNRPQNLRVISDFLTSFDGDIPVPNALEQAAEQARKRGMQEEKEARRRRQEPDKDDDLTEKEWRQVADAEQAQEKLQKKIDELKQRADDPKTDPEETERLRQAARQLEQMRQQLGNRPLDKRQWEELARSDQMRAVLRAAVRGEPLPDSQWNRLMSSLDDGLWQVRRRTPPEEYRRAIEQYQERLRQLMNLEADDAGR